ncbi:UDP-N-acetylglucosamine 1-carboxyvinyltransferase [Desulfotomaculum copahuensis]|uniref:UDP-N-acetylglucosamine 1-carboxyvinyltransferase n=1 Tax=Desulfotomaculum copahuensis TaxID=1838280 RepID=A0A1B7LEZ8_9FIRM|nr:UDP-N-acetylglucosamine 1-carboxyvinyltransferase [Desulfotomaculum copahuensis]OAT81806.1 UDP-N-acetylglucosamine 1-carboxyvinyltransferase [Desulfotomaculum copahuensis]
MEKLMIVGGNRLQGSLRASGSKNAALPILAACLLHAGTSVIREVPRLQDIATMCDVLVYLGARVEREGTVIRVDASSIQYTEVSEDLMRRMRASNLVLGALLGRFHRARISSPGGCNIGSRPMNLHLKGLRALGAVIEEKFGFISASAGRLQGVDIHLDMPSVGATENIMMAAVLADGTTVIRNAAKEPEVVDLQNFLNRMGARVKGAGTDVIRVEGVKKLYSVEHVVIPDRIEAGTYLVAAAVTGGDVTVTNIIPEHLEPLTAKLREAGVEVRANDDSLRVLARGRPRAVDIKTMPYPGFPTDMQPQMMALAAMAEGTSVITETVFENRYKHVSELRRMGADIRVEGQTAIVKGVARLSGAPVEATDLRAGAALVLAALAAENGTVLEGLEHIDRGYERFEQKLCGLGAKVMRVHS